MAQQPLQQWGQQAPQQPQVIHLQAATIGSNGLNGAGVAADNIPMLISPQHISMRCSIPNTGYEIVGIRASVFGNQVPSYIVVEGAGTWGILAGFGLEGQPTALNIFGQKCNFTPPPTEQPAFCALREHSFCCCHSVA